MSGYRHDWFAAWQATLGAAALVVAAVAIGTFGEPVEVLVPVFLVWFIGYLVGVDLFAPRHVAPGGWGRARVVIVVGLVCTVLVVLRFAVLRLR